MILKKYYKTVLILIPVLLLSLLPAGTAPEINFFHLPNLDKYIHFFMYFFLSSALIKDIKNNIKNPARLLIFLVVFLLIIFSGIIEIIQESYIFGRSGSWFDLFANITGIIAGSFFILKIIKSAKSHQDL